LVKSAKKGDTEAFGSIYDALVTPVYRYIFHNLLLAELGIKRPESPRIKKEIKGGGKIMLEMIGDYVECRLYGRSFTYGHYDKAVIDIAKMEKAIEATFHLGMMPILVIPDCPEIPASE
ncbi:hypothetical protein JW758_06415, partial [Candidatus Peregrinibacteria bacterium]|nr:hypothetical protein [Candidatus Peregrinibacteria bacterium]